MKPYQGTLPLFIAVLMIIDLACSARGPAPTPEAKPEAKPEPERKARETKEETEKVPPKAEVSKSLSYDVKPTTKGEPTILMQYQRERLVGLEACAKISAQAYSMSVHSPETHLEVLNKIAEGAEYLLDVLTEKAMK